MLAVDLSDPPPVDSRSTPGVLIGVGEPSCAEGRLWREQATFTLVDHPSDDRRTIFVPSPGEVLEGLRERCERWPQASAVCDDVLRSVDPDAAARSGIITESLGYSTLQAGPEFARWLAGRQPADVPEAVDPVLCERDGGTLRIRFNRPERHNAFSDDMRVVLLDFLTVALVDDSVEHLVLGGNGPSFCSGGDLGTFGRFADPVSAHIARVGHSPALLLDQLTGRLGRNCRAEIHGQILGSGLEMSAFCGWISCRSDAQLGLPELSLGLIPGAGGTVSVTRRIGRWRTAYLVLSGNTIDAATAVSWGLVDEITP